MKTHPIPLLDIEAELKRQGLSRAHLCRKAGINSSTLTRWKNGSSKPLLESYSKIVTAFQELTGIPREELRPDLYPPRRAVRRAHPTPTHDQKETRV